MDTTRKETGSDERLSDSKWYAEYRQWNKCAFVLPRERIDCKP